MYGAPGQQGPPGSGAPGGQYPPQGYPQQPRPAYQQAAAPAQQQQQQQPAAAAAKPKQAWSEHKAPDGRPYWYNSQTKVSTYTRPTELTPPEARAAAAVTDWKEHTAPDGRKYYYNKTTKESKWVPPEEWKRAQAALTGAPAPAAAAAAAAAVASPAAAVAASPAAAAKPVAVLQAVPLAATPVATSAAQAVPEGKPQPTPQLGTGKHMYASKDDAKLAFKQLMGSVGMRSDWTWEQTMRLIASDPRYGALKSLGEKKACFNEYVQQRKNEEREEARAKVKKQREDFTHMLETAEAGREGKPLLRFSEARDLFEDDPRWKAVSHTEREELYQDYLRDAERRQREEKKRVRKQRAAAFRDLLLSTTAIKVDTPWRKASGKLEGDPAYEALDRLDRIEVYQEYIKDLMAKEAAEAEAKKEARRRKERRNRDAFTALVQDHLAAGRLTAKTRFKEYVEVLKDEAAYIAVEGNQSGSRPRELFEDVLEDAEKAYADDRALMKEMVAEGKVVATEETPFADFAEALDEAGSKAAAIPAPHRQMYHEELVARAKEAAAKEKKRQAKAAEAFTDMLRASRDVRADMAWEEARALLASHRHFLGVSSEAERQALYEGHQVYLTDKAERDAEREALRAKRRHSTSPERERDGHKEGKRHKKSKHRDGSSERKEKKHKSHKRDTSEGDRKSKKHSTHDKSPALEKSLPPPQTMEEGEEGEVPMSE